MESFFSGNYFVCGLFWYLKRKLLKTSVASKLWFVAIVVADGQLLEELENKYAKENFLFYWTSEEEEKRKFMERFLKCIYTYTFFF